MAKQDPDANYAETLEMEKALLAIVQRERAHEQPLNLYFEKKISQGGEWIRLDISIHTAERRPSRELITEIRRAMQLRDPKKKYNSANDTNWLTYSESTPYGFAEVTIFGVCQIKGTREKVIEATPRIVVPEKVIEALPERVETVTDYDCSFLDDGDPVATLTEPSKGLPSSEIQPG